MVQGTVTTIYESFMRCLAPGCGTGKGGKKGLGWFGWGSRLKSIVGPLKGQKEMAGLQSRPFKGLVCGLIQSSSSKPNVYKNFLGIVKIKIPVRPIFAAARNRMNRFIPIVIINPEKHLSSPCAISPTPVRSWVWGSC